MKSVCQVAREATDLTLSTLPDASLLPEDVDKAALVAQLAIPQNELLAEAASFSSAMTTLFSHQAHAEVEASVRAYSICLVLTRLRSDV